MPIISVENLSKKYIIGHQSSERYLTFREALNRKIQSAGNKFLFAKKSLTPNSSLRETFWALKDVSFEVEQGDRLGIIGRNGAGKTTLLKILSRITEPTEGRVKIKGRVASLLEVGTGFHPELTGRENIYLNGAILGMSRNEIKKKFDEIVDFAEVEKFLDTPVKRYSSGMYVRLAFAVAAHLEPEILLVDEVLAVGDAEFQKKCLGKMEDVSKNEGRTVLFVSHNLIAVQNLCNSVIVLDEGEQVYSKGNVDEGLMFYNSSVLLKNSSKRFLERNNRRGNGKLRFTEFQFLNHNFEIIDNPVCSQTLIIRLFYKIYEPIDELAVSVTFNSQSNENKVNLYTDLKNSNYKNISKDGYFECHITRFPLAPTTYLMNIFAQSNGKVVDWLIDASVVDVIFGDYYGTGKLLMDRQPRVLIDYEWK